MERKVRCQGVVIGGGEEGDRDVFFGGSIVSQEYVFGYLVSVKVELLVKYLESEIRINGFEGKVGEVFGVFGFNGRMLFKFLEVCDGQCFFIKEYK